MKQIPNEAKGRAKRKNGKSEERGMTNGFAFHGVVEFQAEERRKTSPSHYETNDNLIVSLDVCNILVKKNLH